MTTFYDPPSGWKYGFPKPYNPLPGESITDTLLRDGYPQHEIDRGGAQCVRFIGTKDELPTDDIDSPKWTSYFDEFGNLLDEPVTKRISELTDSHILAIISYLFSRNHVNTPVLIEAARRGILKEASTYCHAQPKDLIEND